MATVHSTIVAPAAALRRRTVMAMTAALAAGAVGMILCWHYPIAPAAMLVAFLAWSAVAFLRPRIWLLVVPSVVPLIGFAPWTGWLTFEELDILVLGTAFGSYMRIGLDANAGTDATTAGNEDRHTASLSLVPALVVTLYVMFAAVSLYRGLADARAVDWGWFHGYYDALNSLRVMKPLLLSVLVAPLMFWAMRKGNARSGELLATGLAVGSAAAAMLVLWERTAFTGILNFSTDYRATALFWEMHVGGAALDGFLALTAPFAVCLLLNASAPWKTAASWAVLAVLGYACLLTFSRGVYLALPVALGLLAALLFAQRKSRSSIGILRLAAFAGLAAIGAVVLHLAFRTGGYRTIAAVVVAFAMMILVAAGARDATFRQWVYAAGAAVLLGAVGILVAAALPKGAYVVFALAAVSCGIFATRHSSSGQTISATATLATYGWLLIATACVALYWGGESALEDTLAAVALLVALLVWSARSSRQVWPKSMRARGMAVGSAALIAGIVAIFSGGAYMTERFSTTESDLALRIHHWKGGLGLLRGWGDVLLGKGLGRFPASYFFGMPDNEFPGSYHLDTSEEVPSLHLAGPTYPIYWGDAFRISQRVHAAPGSYTASFEARADQEVRLHLEVCEKQLLYNAHCAIGKATVKKTDPSWTRITVAMDGQELTSGSWYAPRLAFFSMAVESSGRLIEFRNVSLLGPDGRELVTNGDFSNGMAHWFFTSDRYHLPWHIKNLALNVLFDQGAVGLALFTMLICTALWRLIAGQARSHPLAPYLAAALAGFLIVGMFDSLLDVPRDAFLFYLLLLLSLALQERRADAGP